MPIIFNWLASALAIVLGAAALPGVSMPHPFWALELALAFGGLSMLLPHFFRYADVPMNRFTLAAFGAVVNVGLVLWASVILPGFYIDGFLSAALFAGLITGANVHLALHPVGKKAAERYADLVVMAKQARWLGGRFRSLARFMPRRV